MESSQMKDIICKELDEHKAIDITVLDVEHLTVVTDYFVICTAKSTKQVKALAEFVEDKLKEQGVTPTHSDGMSDGKWAVLDFGEVIVHIFNDETRMFYCLEKLWSDGKNMQRYGGEN
ncbi:MAG: ribosome silencing factor [Bacteroides sp.]|nr:ribosome silencing factor [Bacillota bacterium]MCM1393439.1 ribosome silencing factor [[Eubacterium] siraeum]MCM1455061.1 ribosome silencing factor [Bacteroides sp.]